MTDPTNVFAMDDIKFMTGYNVEPVVASETSVIEALRRYYPTGATPPRGTQKEADAAAAGARACTARSRWRRSRRRSRTSPRRDDVEVLEELEQIDVASLEKQSGEAPVIRLVNLMLMSAIQKGASDIHIEPYEKEFRIRFRIDGILYSVMTPPMKFRDAITSRVKIMAKLDIAEKRLPQDGRIKIRFANDGAHQEIDFRVSCLPTLFGEKIVLRLLDKDKLMLDMTKLGFEPESLAKLEARSPSRGAWCWSPARPAAARPTPSTRRSRKINTPETNIMTAEDPVEFNLVGVNQVQVRENIGLNFAAALRSFLRQDPNIILVGEIRDFETAEIAVKAALTGPPRAVDAAHQRRAQHHQPPDEHGHRAVPGRQLGEPDLRPAAGAPGVPGCAPITRTRRRRWSTRGSRRKKRGPSFRSAAPAASAATRPATRAASASTRSWRSPRSCAS